MPDQDIFDEEPKVTPPITPDAKPAEGIVNSDTASTDQLLASIVNSDGTQKYKSVEEALKATAHAQQFIETLKADNAALKEKGNASEKLDELLEAVKRSKESGDGAKDSPTMKPEDVLGIVKEYFDNTKASETRANNIKTVTTVFKDRYGENASTELYKKAADLGFNREEINGMIANNPKAVLKVLGMEGKTDKKVDTLTVGSVRTSSFSQNEDTAPRSVMGSTRSKDLIDAWNANKQKTLERLGIES